ncbi:MAG: HD-GYP domain-containing protein [Peptostreptococcaceae bacterium]
MDDDNKLKINTLDSFKDTKMHTKRVVNYAVKIGKKLNLDKENLYELALCAKLHDIGKIAIPETILTKPNKLTDEEYEIMKSHTEKGYSIVSFLGEEGIIAKSVLTHHERWDGRGYPLGLKGYEIPLFSRVIAIADSYDAMINERVYKKAMQKDEAINELKKCSSSQFDPELVRVFIECME